MPHDSILSTIGNTPLIRLAQIEPTGGAEIWLKLESGNPTGSYKDRMAVSVLTRAIERGALHPGDRVVEYTGGSTGTALAFVAAALGLRFTAVFSDAFSASKKQAMEAFGAEVLVEPSEDGTITPELIQRMKAHAYALAEEPGSFYAHQFGSPDVRAGYAPMGAEIAASLDGKLDCLIAAVGTGAALMGAADGLATAGCTPDVIALEPAQSPLLTTGKGGPHRVEGIGVGFAPPFLEQSRLADIRAIDQTRAFEMCRTLAREAGIFCGGSTGLNVTAAIDIAREFGPGKKIVTLGCDTGAKYLGGHIYG
ncbi:PLP-dependent cysteine synthase family protein [Gymnodinialimonas ceratoperidinii]|uniref:Cysteine synthase family protein n=1 Tax=Gymnodinialimonas ceratoperidinii TaxID=2856823 RepID=A0A8F6TX43_9RHOB|nr:cysteine synthase family protein [Gymnodinialimonas ceratoperidinii]QXT39539.1 cysteine synthase family protein [Gymnodinialimonas ceratoperidinii]